MIRHPGGLRLTARGIRLAGLNQGAKVLDVGCGDGHSVEYLNNNGFTALGIDEKAENLPFDDSVFDCLMFECVLSVVEDSKAALKQAKRVLKQDGKLIVSDIYSVSSEDLKQQIIDAGFKIIREEDHTPALVTYVNELYSRGETRECCDFKKPGYVLFIGENI